MSKCEHMAGVALRPNTAQRLMRVYLAKGVAATTAIEGNTLTEEEVLKRIEGKLQLPPSKEYLGVEIDNVVAVCNRIKDDQPCKITPELIKGFNRQVLQGLSLEEHIQPGELRTYGVGVAGYLGAPAADLPKLLDQLCAWLDKSWLPNVTTFEKRDVRRLEAILKAVLAHLYLAWIHPFGDGNGRTARLVEFRILLDGGVPYPAAHLLSNHYNQTRSEYYRQLSTASKSGGDVVPFCVYALRGFVDQLRDQIGVIRDEQLRLFWRNHVRDCISDMTESSKRRRHLVLDLAEAPPGSVTRENLRVLSPRVARDYASRSDRTLVRDLGELQEMGLLEVTDGKYRAKTEIVLAYLPPMKSPGES